MSVFINHSMLPLGKKEWELNALLRDIFHEMDHQTTDSFLLAVDFRKAFDSIITDFLYKVMEKMGLPKNL